MIDNHTPPQPQQQRAKDTRARIIRAAGRLFETSGFEGASVNDIITAADTSKGAFYRHFPEGRVGVAKAIMDNTLVMDGVVPTNPKLQIILDTGIILAHRITSEPELRAALRLSLHHNASNIYGTPWRAWIKINTAQLIDAQQHGEVLPNVIPEDQAYQIAGGWSGLVLTTEALDGDLTNLELRVVRMYKNLMHVIATREALMDLDFSVDRACRLYGAFLARQAAAEAETS
ncbi:TetR family transcriptional regulator [Streptomyces sp. NPDC014983]|uniref:TetR family transcriptional regulator n=1 Tax=Streptomyces sp. NPDC014983 TaxID=3364933 RepID=UPI0036F959A1